MDKKEVITALEMDNYGNHFKLVEGLWIFISETEYNELKEQTI
jgi:hypothetical protein